MKVNFKLSNNDWKKIDKISYKGQFFYNNSIEIDVFKDVNDKTEFTKKIKQLNGFYNIIFQNNNCLCVAVDPVRSYPIFFKIQNECLTIYDSLLSINLSDEKIDNISINEFILSGFTNSNFTLFKNIYQIPSGNILIFENGKLSFLEYANHYHNYDNEEIESNNINRLKSIDKSISDKIKFLSRTYTIVIPLSGGYDSRYIATLCKEQNITNVICYTYGRKNSFEVRTSEKVAKELKYQWHFIEYNQEEWNDMLYSPFFLDFCLYSSNYSSLPVYQEFIALKKLKEHNILPENSIFLPGFSGDLLGGSILPQEYFFNKSEKLKKINLNKYIFNKYFTNIKINNEITDQILNRIKFNIKDFKSADDFVSIYENWFTQNRIAKYINNAVRIYEFFGYMWYLPLWDKELIEFWYNVPNKYRIQNKFYNQYLLNEKFKKFNIDYIKEDSLNPSHIRNFIKKILPTFVFDKIKTIVFYIKGKKKLININSFEELASITVEDLRKIGINANEKTHINSLMAMRMIYLIFKI